MNKTSFIYVGFTLMAILLAACSNKKPKDGRTDRKSVV